MRLLLWLMDRLSCDRWEDETTGDRTWFFLGYSVEVNREYVHFEPEDDGSIIVWTISHPAG